MTNLALAQSILDQLKAAAAAAKQNKDTQGQVKQAADTVNKAKQTVDAAKQAKQTVDAAKQAKQAAAAAQQAKKAAAAAKPPKPAKQPASDAKPAKQPKQKKQPAGEAKPPKQPKPKKQPAGEPKPPKQPKPKKAAKGGAGTLPPPPAPSAPALGAKVYTLSPSVSARPATNGRIALTPAESSSVVQQFNTARSKLPGINQQPIPSGLATVHSDGHVNLATADGRQFGLRPNGTLTTYSGAGATATFRSNGQIRALHTSSLDVRQAARGQNVVVARLPDQRVVVSTGPRSGFVASSFAASNGRTVFQRTYVVDGVGVGRVYVPYSFNGLELQHFEPSFQYAPAFYGWAITRGVAR